MHSLELIMRELNQRVILVQLRSKSLGVSFQLRSHQSELLREIFLRLE
jgi:hypothetical protein